jgi:hypothetical protein
MAHAIDDPHEPQIGHVLAHDFADDPVFPSPASFADLELVKARPLPNTRTPHAPSILMSPI